MTTISNIAKAAGVSDMTVSRVLNGKTEYRRPTFARRADNIRKLAKEMGYRPNTFARGVRTGRFRAFGLLLGTDPIRSALPLPLLNGVYQALRERKLNLTTALLPDQALANAGEMPLLLQEQMADGLLVYYTDHIPTGMVESIRGSAVPAVWLNVQHPENCVFPDDRVAGQQAAEHLLRLGHTRIAFVDVSHRPSDPAIHYSAHDRYDGYAQAMTQAGLTPRRLWGEQREDPQERARMIKGWLADGDRPTAIVTLGATNIAQLLVAAAELGLRVPHDLSLISFAGRTVDFMAPAIATMLIPEEQVGEAGVAMLSQLTEQPEQPLPSQAVPFSFDPAASCAPPSLA